MPPANYILSLIIEEAIERTFRSSRFSWQERDNSRIKLDCQNHIHHLPIIVQDRLHVKPAAISSRRCDQ
jgi:hypothetical protein